MTRRTHSGLDPFLAWLGTMLVVLAMALYPSDAHAQQDGYSSQTQSAWATASDGSQRAFAGASDDGAFSGSGWEVAQSGIQFGGGSVSSGSQGDADTISEILGLVPSSQLSGIGGYFLNVMFGSSLVADVVGGQSQSGPTNNLMGAILKYATWLGIAVATAFAMVHAITMFTNYLEYGDWLGEARDRFIGTSRAVITLMLLSPIAAGGLAPAQYGSIWAAASSNGMGNRLAYIVAGKGFGDSREGGSIFSLESTVESKPDATAGTFGEIVGAESCRRQMSALGMSAPEVRQNCGMINVTNSDASGAITVDTDMGSLSDSQIEASCEAIDRSLRNDGALRNVCVNVRRQQRSAQDKVGALMEEYDNDISGPEAQEKLAEIAKEYAEEVDEQINKINESICNNIDSNCANPVADSMAETMQGENTGGGGSGASSSTYDLENVTSSSAIGREFQGMVQSLGWPGLAMIYSSLGDRIDAVGNVQNNGTDSSGFDPGTIKDTNQHMVRVIRQVTRDSTQAEAAANAAGEAAVSGGLNGAMESTGSWFVDLFDGASVTANEWAQNGFVYIFDPLFSKPGPAATYEVGSRVLGTLMIAAGLHDTYTFISNIGSSSNSSTGAGLAEKMSGFFSSEAVPFGEGSVILYAVIAVIGLFLVFLLMMAAFMVFVLPKLPILIVGLLVAEWAIWCAIIVWGSTLWVAINLSSLTNTPHLGTAAFLRGLGVVMYLLLYPILVVIAIVVSVIIYNLLVPTLSMLMVGAFGAGKVDSILGIFAMPFIMLFAAAIAAFVSITAISRVPDMINGMLGLQTPGQSVSGSLNTFVGGPQNYNNVTGPQAAFQNAMGMKGMK